MAIPMVAAAGAAEGRGIFHHLMAYSTYEWACRAASHTLGHTAAGAAEGVTTGEWRRVLCQRDRSDPPELPGAAGHAVWHKEEVGWVLR